MIGPGSYVDDFRHGFHFFGKVLAKKAPPGVVRVRWADGSQSFVQRSRLQRLNHRPRQRCEIVVGFVSPRNVEPYDEVLVEAGPVGYRIIISDIQGSEPTIITDFAVLGVKNVSYGPVIDSRAHRAKGITLGNKLGTYPRVKASERMSLRLRNRQQVAATLHVTVTGFYEQSP